MEIINIHRLLIDIKEDYTTHRRVAFITGNEQTSLYIVELLPEQSLPPHYHKKNTEIYYVLSGEATLYIRRNEDTTRLTIERNMKKGDAITIHPNEIHQITNCSNKVLQILGIAPQSHNATDRYFAD